MLKYCDISRGGACLIRTSMSDHGADNDLQALLDFGRRVCVPTQVIEDISDLPYLATIARVAQWSFDSIPVRARHTFREKRED